MKKATFKKSDSFYPHGSLREQPEMERPEQNDFYEYDRLNPSDMNAMGFNIDAYRVTCEAYQKHLDSLRTIPCSENNWKDGQELTQNIDYVVISNDPDSGNFLAIPMDVAVPVQETEKRPHWPGELPNEKDDIGF